MMILTVSSNTGTFQYLGLEVYLVPKHFKFLLYKYDEMFMISKMLL